MFASHQRYIACADLTIAEVYCRVRTSGGRELMSAATCLHISLQVSAVPFPQPCGPAAVYVRGDVHTEGIARFSATLKRAHKCVYRKISKAYPERYVKEFSGQHNARRA